MRTYFFYYNIEMGKITIIYDENGVVSLMPPYENFSNTKGLIYKENTEIVKYLDNYFSGIETEKLKLNINVSEFQNKVYNVLLNTGRGTILTYGDVAKLIGCGSPRAVGQALKKNPVPIIIPCHRVVGRGWAGGYAGETDGIKMNFKNYLLKIEKS